jgi:hypothetical protein
MRDEMKTPPALTMTAYLTVTDSILLAITTTGFVPYFPCLLMAIMLHKLIK